MDCLAVRIALGILLASLLGAACGGDDFETKAADPPPPPSPCHGEPWNCPAGQTCWPAGDGLTYECFNQGPKAAGETCQLFAGAPTCRAGLFCGNNDVCVPFCSTQDPDHVCPGGMVCLPLTVNGVQGEIQICIQQ